MPATDSVQPVFYILFGAFIVLLGLYVWRSFRRRFSSQDRMGHNSKAFSVRLIDDASASSKGHRWQWETLTRREREVARLAARGLHNAEIAQELKISSHTVATYLKKIYRTLHVHSRLELAQAIRELGE